MGLKIRSVALAFLLLSLLLLHPSSASLPSASPLMWSSCTAYGQIGTECALLKVFLDQDNPDPTRMINSFVRRFYSGPAPTNNSIWCVAGGPGDSTTSFTGMAEVFVANDPTVTVYLVDQRGTGMSSLMTCENQPGTFFDPSNNSLIAPWEECYLDVLRKYGNDLPYYSTYHAALDFLSVVNAVNPDKIAIYALSCGTYFINTYLLLPGARADVMVLDGPVPPTRWALENNAEWVSHVAQDVIEVCKDSSVSCLKHMGIVPHSPRLLMDDIIDGTLPCMAKLKWVSQLVVSSIMQQMLTSPNGRVAMGPFWWRLHRCSASDVEQLDFYYRTHWRWEVPPPNPADYSLGLAMAVATSELYSFAPPGQELDYDFQVRYTGRLFASAGVQLSVSYGISVDHWPRYTVNPTVFRKFAKPTMPVLILVGTMDPNTEYGLGSVFQEGLSEGNPSANVVLGTVPYANHGTLEPDAYCVQSIILPFLKSFGAQPANLTCLSQLPCPDFEGAQAATQNYSTSIFGVPNLWNDDV